MEPEFWILAFSYWIHLIGTVIWFGGMIIMALAAFPALQRGGLSSNQWLHLQQRFVPWVNGSLVLLLITGFVQMTLNPNYTGFLEIDGVWAWAMLLKHIAFVALVSITVLMQVTLYPAIRRTNLLAEKRPKLAAAEQDRLSRREQRLLRLNLLCAMAILFFTAVATAV